MDERKLDEILENLHPAIRAQLEELFDAPHLQGLSRIEIFMTYRVKSKENVTESGWWVQMKMLL